MRRTPRTSSTRRFWPNIRCGLAPPRTSTNPTTCRAGDPTTPAPAPSVTMHQTSSFESPASSSHGPASGSASEAWWWCCCCSFCAPTGPCDCPPPGTPPPRRSPLRAPTQRSAASAHSGRRSLHRRGWWCAGSQRLRGRRRHLAPESQRICPSRCSLGTQNQTRAGSSSSSPCSCYGRAPRWRNPRWCGRPGLPAGSPAWPRYASRTTPWPASNPHRGFRTW
mmetsp:Transcript_8416/g.23401  ORF Transcript_8416/g.23401 Transcript_8416/m.23401 type:complete len:222 (-) Transcript_8416:115-780(-)